MGTIINCEEETPKVFLCKEETPKVFFFGVYKDTHMLLTRDAQYGNVV